MSNYTKGAAKERKVMAILQDKLGCQYVSRVAGSHSEFDVMGINEEHIYLVQVKSGKTMPIKVLSKLNKYKNDLEKISNLSLDIHALKELWLFAPRKEAIKINVFPMEKYKRLPE